MLVLFFVVNPNVDKMNQMNEDQDDWDMLLNFEMDAYKQGEDEGIKDATDGDMYENGIQCGFVKGLALGLEIGYMRAISTKSKRLIEGEMPDSSIASAEFNDDVTGSHVFSNVLNDNHNHNSSGSNEVDNVLVEVKDTENSTVITNRSSKWDNQLQKRLSVFPTTNIPEFDFDNEIRELRGLYKMSGAAKGIGSFPYNHKSSSITFAAADVETALQNDSNEISKQTDYSTSVTSQTTKTGTNILKLNVSYDW